ncbi:MAG: ligase-associated DNA damage response endonuclease PdeM [Dongiaceae bacterium]
MPTARPALVGVMGVVLEAFQEGALWWDDLRLLVVADLHLEKGSSFARRGQLVPPYDTVETLSRIARLIARLDPLTIVSLGDSFHDGEASARLSASDRGLLTALQHGREWFWISGNHDPGRPSGLGGTAADELAVGKLVFRHEPTQGQTEGEIAGHLHPCARVHGRGRSVRRACFAGDGYRLILPAFGAYTGGLDILDSAFAGLFQKASFRAFMLGDDRVYPVGRRALGA